MEIPSYMGYHYSSEVKKNNFKCLIFKKVSQETSEGKLNRASFIPNSVVGSGFGHNFLFQYEVVNAAYNVSGLCGCIFGMQSTVSSIKFDFVRQRLTQ